MKNEFYTHPLLNIIFIMTQIMTAYRVYGFEKNAPSKQERNLIDGFDTEIVFIKTIHSKQIFQVLSSFAHLLVLLSLLFVIGVIIILINVCFHIMRTQNQHSSIESDPVSAEGTLTLTDSSGSNENYSSIVTSDSSIINVCPILNFKEYSQI